MDTTTDNTNIIRLSIDTQAFDTKPTEHDVPIISNRIAKYQKSLNLNEINDLIDSVATKGHTFCSATFKDGKRSKETFEQQQIFALDFDNKDKTKAVSIEDVKARADFYDLPILFSYDTFSSTEHDKFRVIFLNDAPVTHRSIAEAMQLALGEIFPEADKSCYKNVAAMYFGGRGLIYQDETIPTINVESVFRGLTYRLKDTKGNHYKERLAQFSRETGIELNKNGFLDVRVTDNPTESLGATQSHQDGKISPRAITYGSNVIGNGEMFPTKYYQIIIHDRTSKPSVVTSINKIDVTNKEYKNHNPYRRSDIDRMGSVCRLFHEFETGSRDMTHGELFGLLNNLMCVDSGITRFKEIQAEHPNLYDSDRRREWERHISYNRLQGYKPSSCNGFCPYRAECNHGTNILSTVRPRAGMMERIPSYHEEFHPIEDVQDDTYCAIRTAFLAEDNLIHIIKSMTGAGKSYSYLQLMAENPEDRFLIAAPTNLLKNELHRKASRMGIEVCKTPSLEEIKSEIPPKVWKHIQRLYKSGQHHLVHVYIAELLKKRGIPCLGKYMKEREALKNFHGSIITTHRYLLNMDEKRLREYDAIIIDEDIIFKSIIPNQEEIPIRDLKKLSREVSNRQVSEKIKRLITLAENQSCIELESFEYDIEEDGGSGFDLPSLCLTERFYVRRSSKEPNLKEDTVVFLKPATLKNVKYILVSATADESICRTWCRTWLGKDRIDFYECKKAAYQGTLNQYPGKSMSRTSITNNPGIVRRLMKQFGISEDRVITFMKEKIGKLHFGNAEGSNDLEGQDILVVGTPYHADFLYKLAAFTMGLVLYPACFHSTDG